MIKLDATGTKQWQKMFTSGNALFNPVASWDHSLMMLQMTRNPNETILNTFKKLNEKGEIVASSAPMKGD
jgi:hypothetical protein